jgi:predicted CopG family antitoxin
LRQRAQQFIQEVTARQLRRGQNDRLVKAKALEQSFLDVIKAERQREKRRQQIVYIVIGKDSDEDLGEGRDEDSKTSKGRDWNTCLSSSCFVVLLLVCNLLFLQCFYTRQVQDKR